MDSKEQISRFARRFLSGTVLSRFTGMLREIVMAAAFGSVPAVAAFFVAFRFANLPRRLFGEGVMPSVFVPLFESLRADSEERANRFTADFILSLSLFLVLFSLLIEGALALVPSSDVIHLTQLMVPALLFICLYGVNLAYLNCQKVYFLPSAAPVFFNFVWIGSVALIWRQEPAKAMEHLALLIIVAYFAQWAITLPLLWRNLNSSWRRPKIFSYDVKKILKPLSLGILGAGATQINYALDPIFARLADPSGPAYLWYAIRLQQVPLAFFGLALSGALLPPLARAVRENNTHNYTSFLTFANRRAIDMMIPCTVAIFVMGFAAVSTIYGHGRFTPEDSYFTTQAFYAYGVGLLPMTLVLVQGSACYVHNDYRTPAIASTLAVLANVLLNTLFVFLLHWGAFAIALATSASSFAQLIALQLVLHRQGRAISLFRTLLVAPLPYLAVLAAASATLALATLLPATGALSLLMQAACFFSIYSLLILLSNKRRAVEI